MRRRINFDGPLMIGGMQRSYITERHFSTPLQSWGTPRDGDCNRPFTEKGGRKKSLFSNTIQCVMRLNGVLTPLYIHFFV